MEQGAEAVENLLFPDTTGAYYDGKRLSKAINQTHYKNARLKLKKITGELLGKFL